MEIKKQKTALITGAAGFIGFHVRKYLSAGWKVIGLDSMSNYYDVDLKEKREDTLLQFKDYMSVRGKVEEPSLLMSLFETEKPELVVHLAAQAGVRHSIDSPRTYLESNIMGTFELLEAARHYAPEHLLMASTSSVYGANKETTFIETLRLTIKCHFMQQQKNQLKAAS